MEFINPPSAPPPKGYNNGVKAGRTLYIAGQVAYDGKRPVVKGKTVVEQFDGALAHVVSVVTAAGGRADQIVKLTIFVKDMKAYKSKLKEIGEVYRKHLGKHFPAMSCVEVSDLFDDGALVEIEGVAEIG
jgi:enamine deaminase RidA (YjgF/YER057c/UK114 family)